MTTKEREKEIIEEELKEEAREDIFLWKGIKFRRIW